MSFSDTPVLRPISNKRKPAIEESPNTVQDERQDNYNNHSNNSHYNDSGTLPGTSFHYDTPNRQQYQGKQNNFNGNRPFLNQQYYRFFQYARSDNAKQFTFQRSFDESNISANRMMQQRDFNKNSPFNNCSFKKFPNKPRNNYPAIKSLNPRAFPKGYKNFFALNSGSNDFRTEDYGNFVTTNSSSTVQINRTNNLPKNDSKNVPKKETQKLKILRHTPVPASAKISPKKIIEKITKFNKASLKNIINNPSKYDEVLQKFGREQALEDQKNEPQTTKAKGKSDDEDKGIFEIVPDDTVEVSAEFFDFLQMDAEKSPIMGLDNEKTEHTMESRNDETQPKLDLMSRLIAAENIKTNHAKKHVQNTLVKSKNNNKFIDKDNHKEKHIILRNEKEKFDAEETIELYAQNDNETDLQQQIYELSDDSICNEVIEVENVDSKNGLFKSETQNVEHSSLEQTEDHLDKTNEQTTFELNNTACNSPRACNSGKNSASSLKVEALSPKPKHVAINNDVRKAEKSPSSTKNEQKATKSLLSLVGTRRSRIDSLPNGIKKTNQRLEDSLKSTKNKKPTGRRTNSSSCSSSSSTSSRSGSSSSSSSTSTSSSTTSSSCSSASQKKLESKKKHPDVRKQILLKRRRHMLSQKLNIQHIVDTFEARILPSLAQHLVQRYREKYSKSLDTKLLFICRICTNNQYKERLQNDLLKSTDKKKAIIILMREVKNVINKQPQNDNIPQHTEATKNNENPVKEITEAVAADCGTKIVDIAENVELRTHQSVETKSVEDITTDETNLNCSAASNDVEEEKQQFITVSSCKEKSDFQNCNEKNVDSTDVVVKTDVTNDPAPLVPFMPSTQFLSAQQPTSPAAFTNFASFANMGNMPNNLLPMNMQQQAIISDPWITNIHDIDCRISDLVKRKQFINEMIAKLQRDNMELDMQIVGLQKEKFMLLNAAISANATSQTQLLNNSKDLTTKSRNPTKCKKTIKRNLSNRQSPNDTPKSKNARFVRPQKNRLSRIMAIEETQQSDKENAETTNANQQAISSESISEPIDSFDYTNIPTGELTGIESPVNQLCVYQDCIIAATEGGHLYRFNMTTLEMIEQCQKHDTTITQLNFCTKNLMVYTTCLDGYLKATSLNNLQTEAHEVHLDEQIQSLDIQWDCAFIGARSGNIYTCNIMMIPLTAAILHSGDSSIMAIKATKEGPRKILIISSKGNSILFRDSINGLLLRTINVTDNLCIYGFLFDDAHFYCGTQRQQVLKFDFTTGTHISTFYCGNGVVAIRLYRSKYLIVACYDGYIYILNKITGDKVEMLPASGRLPLTLEVFGNKLLTSSKDKTMKIIDIPSSIVNG